MRFSSTYTGQNNGTRCFLYVKENHLGNVIAVVNGKKIAVDSDNNGINDYFSCEMTSANDYYCFGGKLPSRSFNSNSMRFQFNGKEFDQETGTQDYGMRIYNPNLGKFLSVDPLQKEFAWNSSYAFAENDVIRAIDLDGAEKNYIVEYQDKSGTKLWYSVPYSKIHPGIENGPLGKGDYVYYKDPKTNQYTGKYYETFAESNPIKAFFGSEYNDRYTGTKGLKQLGSDVKYGAKKTGKALGESSTYVKGAGLLITASSALVGPEVIPIGVAVYNAGARMDDASKIIDVATTAVEGNVSQSLEKSAKFATDKTIGFYLKGLGKDKSTENFLNEMSGESLDIIFPSDEKDKANNSNTQPK